MILLPITVLPIMVLPMLDLLMVVRQRWVDFTLIVTAAMVMVTRRRRSIGATATVEATAEARAALLAAVIRTSGNFMTCTRLVLVVSGWHWIVLDLPENLVPRLVASYSMINEQVS